MGAELSIPLVFHTSSEMSIKGISAIYADFITPLSILKGSADVKKNILEKCEMRVLHFEF